MAEMVSGSAFQIEGVIVLKEGIRHQLRLDPKPIEPIKRMGQTLLAGVPDPRDQSHAFRLVAVSIGAHKGRQSRVEFLFEIAKHHHHFWELFGEEDRGFERNRSTP